MKTDMRYSTLVKLFEALDDEVLLCINTQNEVSEKSIQALKQAEKLRIGGSKALGEWEKQCQGEKNEF